MEVRNLYTLRYRQGSLGVQTGFITASSPAKANEVGQWWCNQQPNIRFVRVEPAILADESDLPKLEEPVGAGVGSGFVPSGVTTDAPSSPRKK